MKSIAALLILFAMTSITNAQGLDSVYQYELTTIDGEKIPLTSYEDKVLLIVNTASECGYTPQYEGLQKLYEEYNDKGLVVIGFPANNFGGQEPGTNEEIKEFCKVNYGVNFPLSAKVSVKGEDINPLFSYLTSEGNADFTGEIEWNFEKFLIGQNGELLHRFRSAVEPQSNEIINAIDRALSS